MTTKTPRELMSFFKDAQSFREIQRFFDEISKVSIDDVLLLDNLLGTDDQITVINNGDGSLTLSFDSPTKFGSDITLNYSNFENDGTLVFYGDATVWEDLRVPVLSTTSGGSNPPTFSKFLDDGNVGTGSALEFDESNDEWIQIPSSASLNFDSSAAPKAFTIGFGIRIEPGFSDGRLFEKDGSDGWQVRLRGNADIQFQSANGLNARSDNPLNIGSINWVVITVSGTTTDSECSIYINNQLEDTDTDGDPLADNTDVIYINTRNGSTGQCDFDLDELRIWNSVLTEAQRTAFYNDGAGTETPIATEVCGYHFNEGSGTDADNFEGTAALDIDFTTSGNDPAWITGFISGASRGVYTYLFDQDIQQELYFTAQFSHARKNGTDIYPHVHWSPTDTDTGDVRWGLEYTWIDIGGTFDDTTIIYIEDTADGTAAKHQIAGSSTIDGSTIEMVSSMMVCRIFRDATSTADTYTTQAALLEIDFHYEIDTVGSRQERTK